MTIFAAAARPCRRIYPARAVVDGRRGFDADFAEGGDTNAYRCAKYVRRLFAICPMMRTSTA